MPYMRFIAPLLAFALLAVTRTYADQNAAPTSVGLSNYSTVSLTTSTTQAIVPRNTKRASVIISNTGATNAAVVKLGSTPASATDGFIVPANSTLQLLPPPVDAIYAKAAASTTTLSITEGIK